MKQILLDTNFILSCVKQKIDFFENLNLKGLQILIPKQVIEELKKISESKKKMHFKEDAKLALKILNANKFKKIDIKEKYVDKGIIKYAKDKPEIIIATLDKEIQDQTKNQKIIIKQKKMLEYK